jgi:hypothetical protein
MMVFVCLGLGVALGLAWRAQQWRRHRAAVPAQDDEARRRQAYFAWLEQTRPPGPVLTASPLRPVEKRRRRRWLSR